jgi:hypothetical protein
MGPNAVTANSIMISTLHNLDLLLPALAGNAIDQTVFA